ncbi:multiple coagulation factor deficiency protein 2 homolog isoform X2 [Plodia interpunctella]|uniref:multiple coagulation factor deficiency protein 2 homolog isoform X2 n=1 Tax=Plodia interpunctella TaxID=58824 RepID=UPI0023677129|nr:multiple coagulation factor deficiency protein 2 homolog isoform X2 [Plodia interpunctella]
MLRFVFFFAAVLQCTISQQYQQKVAPGVPPQNYQNYQPPPPPQQPVQQQPPQQQYQQQQYQPPPQQFQQLPVQNVPVQQAPAQHQAQGHAHHGDPQLLNVANINQERDHIQEHMDVPIDTSKMSEQELQFHYFKMHDSDNNNKLDGCELIKSLIHWHGPDGQEQETVTLYKDSDFEEIVEGAMKQADFNKDGYIDYGEFKMATLR